MSLHGSSGFWGPSLRTRGVVAIGRYRKFKRNPQNLAGGGRQRGRAGRRGERGVARAGGGDGAVAAQRRADDGAGAAAGQSRDGEEESDRSYVCVGGGKKHRHHCTHSVPSPPPPLVLCRKSRPRKVLKRHGLERYPSLGESFDPNLHNALFQARRHFQLIARGMSITASQPCRPWGSK